MTWYDKGGGGKIPGKTSDVINERPLIEIHYAIVGKSLCPSFLFRILYVHIGQETGT